MIGQPPNTMAAVVSILSTLNASTAAPETVSGEYVRVSRVGGRMSTPVTDTARVLVECWADSNAKAEVLADKVRFRLCNSGGKTFNYTRIRWCSEVSGPVDYPDTVGP